MVQADTMLLEMAEKARQWGKRDFQAIVEADEPVPAHRSVAERSLLLGSTDLRPARSLDVVAGATSGLLSPFFVVPVHQQTFDSSEVVYLFPVIVRRPSSRSAGSKRRV